MLFKIVEITLLVNVTFSAIWGNVVPGGMTSAVVQSITVVFVIFVGVVLIVFVVAVVVGVVVELVEVVAVVVVFVEVVDEVGWVLEEEVEVVVGVVEMTVWVTLLKVTVSEFCGKVVPGGMTSAVVQSITVVFVVAVFVGVVLAVVVGVVVEVVAVVVVFVEVVDEVGWVLEEEVEVVEVDGMTVWVTLLKVTVSEFCGKVVPGGMTSAVVQSIVVVLVVFVGVEVAVVVVVVVVEVVEVEVAGWVVDETVDVLDVADGVDDGYVVVVAVIVVDGIALVEVEVDVEGWVVVVFVVESVDF